MSEMVERVAVALAKSNGGDFFDPKFYTEEQRNVWRTKARDGISAMREPTTAMLAAGDCEIFEDRAAPTDWQLRAVRSGWRAMVDAALTPSDLSEAVGGPASV